jgi:site-specific DNA-cytosine methylase
MNTNKLDSTQVQTQTKQGNNHIDLEQSEMAESMYVIKRTGEREEVSFDKCIKRIQKLSKDLKINPTEPKSILSESTRIPVKNILLPKDKIDKSYYLSEIAITGIKNKKIKALENKNGFGAQYLDLNKPSFTIPARYWKDGYDALVKYSETEIRRLTILELKRIQSFPDDYILEGSKKDQIMQIGNAVACRFAYHLGKHLMKILQ